MSFRQSYHSSTNPRLHGTEFIDPGTMLLPCIMGHSSSPVSHNPTMTQIISVITADWVILVSDRLLTHASGPLVGQVFHDDECKLVSLCHMCGIGYSGLATLGGMPTHKWIARTVAAAGCRDAGHASETLLAKAPAALQHVATVLRRQSFVISGWA